MATENLVATKRTNISVMVSNQVKAMHGLNIAEWTVELATAASDTSTYHIAHLPSNARISGASHVSWDDQASTGAPVLEIGTFGVSGGSIDVDSFNTGLDLAAAGIRVGMFAEIADYGKYLWEIAGESSDPGDFIDIKLTLDDADVNAGGTISGVIFYMME